MNVFLFNALCVLHLNALKRYKSGDNRSIIIHDRLSTDTDCVNSQSTDTDYHQIGR